MRADDSIFVTHQKCQRLCENRNSKCSATGSAPESTDRSNARGDAGGFFAAGLGEYRKLPIKRYAARAKRETGELFRLLRHKGAQLAAGC